MGVLGTRGKVSPWRPAPKGTSGHEDGAALTFGEHLQADAGVAPLPVWGVEDVAVVGALVLQLHVVEGEGHVVLGGVPSELHPVPEALQLLVHDLHPELKELRSGESCWGTQSPRPPQPSPIPHHAVLTPFKEMARAPHAARGSQQP